MDWSRSELRTRPDNAPRRAKAAVSASWAAVLLLAIGALGRTTPLDASSGRSLEAAEEQAFRRAGAAVAKSVVRIQTVGGVDRVGGVLTGTAATTGVIVSEDGFIVSSAFNFIAKPTSILIQVPGGHAFPARQVATDRLRMITLLKIEAAGLVPLRPRRDKDKPARPGQWAIAVGRTYESPEPSVSVGIVSAVNRVWGKAIQTDAKVSPVNYGGPLVDIAGDVLGVVVPLSPSGKEETAGVEWYDSGIGFAIPYEDVLESVKRLMKGKDLSPGLLGVTFKEHGLDERPVIDVVRYDSPAERAGLKAGDALLEIDGQRIRRFDEVKLALGRKYAGDQVTVVASRGDARIRAETRLVDALLPFEPGFLGILPSRLAGDGQHGVHVRFVFPHSAAESAGILAGDRVRKWNGVEVADADRLTSMVRRTRPGTTASLVIVRDGAEKTVNVKISADVEEIPSGLPSFRALAPDGKAIPPAASKGADKKLKTGHFRDKLPGEGSPGYWAYVPESYSTADSWGLIIWIPPTADTMEAAVLSRWQRLCEERRLMIVSPTPAEATGFNPNDLVGARQVLEYFLKTYHIDRNRVVVHAFSFGAGFASVFAFDNHEHVRGLAVAAGSIAAPPPEGHPNDPFRFFFSCGDDDRMGARVRRLAQALRRLKFVVTLQITPASERTTYPSNDETAELARWVDSLDRI